MWNPFNRRPAPETKVQVVPALKSEPVKVGVSISRKLNMGNYESADVWISLTGIDANTTEADIQAALAAGALGYGQLKVAVTEKVQDLRKNGNGKA